MDDLEAITPDDDGPGGEAPPAAAHEARFSRRAKIGAAALAAAAVAAGGLAVGAATQSSSGTVRIQQASASSGVAGQAAATSGGRRGMRRGAMRGTVANPVTSTSFGLTTTRPGASSTTTPVTVDVTDATTYTQVSSATGVVKNLTNGTVITATGTRDATTGDLAATSISERPAGGPAPATRPAGPAGVAHKGPFAIGTVTGDTDAGVITITTPGGGTETITTSATTTELTRTTVTYAAVTPGAQVIVQGTPSATSGGPLTATNVTVIPANISAGPALLGPGGPGGPGFGWGPGGFGGRGMFGRPAGGPLGGPGASANPAAV